MDDELKEKIKGILQTLPPKLREIVRQVNETEIARAIGAKFNLHLDQIDSLITEMTLVLLGIQPSSDFIRNLARELNISGEQATAIANEANEQVFKKVRDELVGINGTENAAKPAMPTPPTPVPAPTTSRYSIPGKPVQTLQNKSIPQVPTSPIYPIPKNSDFSGTGATKPMPPANLPVAPEKNPAPAPTSVQSFLNAANRVAEEKIELRQEKFPDRKKILMDIENPPPTPRHNFVSPILDEIYFKEPDG